MADTVITAQTVIDNTIARLKDSSTSSTQWKDPELLSYLNNGLRFVDRIIANLNSEIGITGANITLVAGTGEYALSTVMPDFMKIAPKGVYFSNVSESLTPVDYDARVRNGGASASTQAIMYYFTPNAIGILPVPDATAISLNNTLSVRYFEYRATELVSGDTMPYVNIFNDTVSAFITSMALLRRESNNDQIAALYDALEASTIQIIKDREGL